MSTVRHLLQIKGADVWVITPGESVYEALRLMADKDIGALLVVENDKLVGIISERDYARKIILHGKSSKETLVEEIMTPKLITVHPDQTVNECMELMSNHHIRHLPVVLEGRVLGVISIMDVVRDIIYQQRQTIKSLEQKLVNNEG
jgi:Predicted signal-transduction protein containing cAMP-binding and CBS domains